MPKFSVGRFTMPVPHDVNAAVVWGLTYGARASSIDLDIADFQRALVPDVIRQQLTALLRAHPERFGEWGLLHSPEFGKNPNSKLIVAQCAVRAHIPDSDVMIRSLEKLFALVGDNSVLLSWPTAMSESKEALLWLEDNGPPSWHAHFPEPFISPKTGYSMLTNFGDEFAALWQEYPTPVTESGLAWRGSLFEAYAERLRAGDAPADALRYSYSIARSKASERLIEDKKSLQ